MTLESYLRDQRKSKDLLLMTHCVCGFPSFEDNWKELEIMAAAGVSVVELQFPFSEPSADGPTFVRANQVALANGVTIEQCFEFLEKVAKHFPFKVLMMGYVNTAFKMGFEKFCARLEACGAVGFILPDFPLEESAELFAAAAKHHLAPVILMTPTTPDDRLKKLGAAAQGFVYAVARKGVTGVKTDMDDETTRFLAKCRAATSVPLAVGFGVQTKADLDFLRGKCDIAIIGTAVLRIWEKDGEAGLKKFFKELVG